MLIKIFYKSIKSVDFGRDKFWNFLGKTVVEIYKVIASCIFLLSQIFEDENKWQRKESQYQSSTNIKLENIEFVSIFYDVKNLYL